ncbi:hypothetical protein BDV96DRAFT_578651 [Lophiotrema nucula]|uniref:N-acetyltransferase domain-containing protein n=1 Tax=Lophiotrema nucula TaxID=690887 RepID=A0A6A5Z1F1_9PLEO|nr:hypothetical protein BDV96DRAFT_578651 [Lophiotrema nucula]
MAASQIEIRTLGSTATQQDLAPLFSLNQTVFGFDPENPRPNASLPEWQTRLSKPDAALTYAIQAQGSTEPMGFFFTYPILQPEIGHLTYHIWLAGVNPSSRGLGIFPLLFEETRKKAKEAGYECLSVCTVPMRFEKMYRILQKNGWEFVAWREGGEKVLMKMKI